MDTYTNTRLKGELSNSLYDIVDDAIKYVVKKQEYHKNDIIKLITAIYSKKYEYITNDNDYREQIKLLDDYFNKEYNYSLIIFVIIKNALNHHDYNELIRIIKKPKLKDEVLTALENHDYLTLMEQIKNNKNVFLAFAKLYENYNKEELNG